ncbi:MAG: Ig-like domain-containing protein [Geodermatophilaceae bacterium]|nr:Ig-like domain-containing protein [Geodermatophilaceae bacterium]
MLLATLALGTACESNPGTQPRLNSSVLMILQVLPSTVWLDQGSTLELRVIARDQRREPLTASGRTTFSSSDSAVARVDGNGVVTGVALGTAEISATRTVAGVTRTAAMAAAIRRASPPADLKLTAELERGWQPSVAHVAAGGTVQWLPAGPRSWSELPHRMLYLLDDKGYVVDSLDLRTGFATRKFMTAGAYRYCSAGCWDSPDFGIVYVQ